MLIALLAATAAMCVVVLMGRMLSPRSAQVAERLGELRRAGESPFTEARRHQRQREGERLREMLEDLGRRVGETRPDAPGVRRMLASAGFLAPNAPQVYWATRLLLACGLPLLAMLAAPM